ncbi:MAG: phosphoglycerate mutase [Phycisphaerae bacterium SM23_33]|jgi:2,3-bisphosphoglycerate-independent phosphoglycerate mutase|nr:MAG: phosphoglycerate mutase [Phycisphaerae bacterium SM23_33]
MKYAIVIPDGAADVPLDELRGRTPLAAANLPNMNRLSGMGKLGMVRTVPPGMDPGSDVAMLSVLGYDPRQYYTGRAPLEAAARGLEIGPEEWVFRCNFVTITDGIMDDHSAGHITTEEATALIAELNRLLAGDRIRFHPGISYRHLMTVAGRVDIATTPPHDILGQPVAAHMPRGPGSEILATLIQRSESILGGHEINQVRRDLGENPATHIWLWGGGRSPRLPSFAERFGIRGSAITAVDLVRGLAKLIGWDCIEVPGATGFLDTNYAGKGSAAVEALGDHDLVCVHIEAPDEASHQADAVGKVRALEQIDRHIVGPLLAHLQGGSDDWRLLLLPDHPTPCTRRTHTAEAVPFAIAGTRVASVVKEPFTEEAAGKTDLKIDRGWELMEFFLKVR